MSSVGMFPVFLVAFLAAIAAVYFGQKWLNRPRGDATARPPEPEDLDWMNPVDGSLLKMDNLSSISFLDELLARFDGIGLMQSRIAEAGLKWSVGRVTLAMLLAGAATWAVLSKLTWLPAFAIIGIVALAASGPYFLIMRRRRQKLMLFEDQFPDALDTVARALRAGNSLAGALDLLARETKAPVGPEIRKTVDERNLGMSWDQALANFATRIPTQEVSMFVAAINLQSRTGGRLHEVLTRLAENMRESSALKGEIRAIAAHGKATGMILTILPVAIALLMTYVNPAQMAVLWTDPAGKSLVLAAVGCLIAAHFVIRKMVDIKI